MLTEELKEQLFTDNSSPGWERQAETPGQGCCIVVSVHSLEVLLFEVGFEGGGYVELVVGVWDRMGKIEKGKGRQTDRQTQTW